MISMKIFYEEKYFTSKQTEHKNENIEEVREKYNSPPKVCPLFQSCI
jgi:hypothetical protein